MISLFQIASQDQSVYYLANIFGVVGNLLPIPADGSSHLILGTLFKTINMALLTLGTLIIAYTVIVGLLATAHEGEFLGREWSGIWTPIRMVIGIISLYPGAGGYSILQIAVMWMVMQGIGAADTVWGTALKYVQTTGSPYSGISPPPGGAYLQMQNLFQGLVCQANAQRSDKIMVPGSDNRLYYYCAANGGQDFCSNATLTLSADSSVSTYQMGPSGSCGIMTYCNEAQKCQTPGLACEVCKAQKGTLQLIVTTLGGIADQFVQTDYEYINFYDNPVPANQAPNPPDSVKNYCAANNISPDQCCFNRETSSTQGLLGSSTVVVPCAQSGSFFPDYGQDDITNTSTNAAQKIYLPYSINNKLPSSLKNSDFIETVASQYMAAIASTITTYVATQPPTILNDWYADANNVGWILAGRYYFKIAKLTQSKMDDIIPTFAVQTQDPHSNDDNLMRGFRNNFKSAGDLVAVAQAQANSNSFSLSMPSQLAPVSSSIGTATNSLASAFMSLLSSGEDGSTQDPLAAISNFGYGMLIAAQAIWASFLAIGFSTILVSSFDWLTLGTGTPVPPLAAAVLFIFGFFSPLIMAICAALFSMGGLLGIYVPLIPYIVFTMGAIGWLIAVVESMVAAPLVALGVLSPGGHNKIWGKAEPAVMLLFNILLRPTLMIFGMMAAMLVATVVIRMINAGFGMVMTDILPNAGLFEQILFLAAYTFLIVSALNKAFSLIYHIPDRVLSWISGHPAGDHGVQEALGEVKQGGSAAAAKTEQAGAQSAQGAGHVSMREKNRSGGKKEDAVVSGSKPEDKS